MSHKDAKPKTAEQLRMEAFYNARLAPAGATIGWGLDKHSEYLAGFARDAWAAWQAAREPLLQDAERWQEFNRHGVANGKPELVRFVREVIQPLPAGTVANKPHLAIAPTVVYANHPLYEIRVRWLDRTDDGATLLGFIDAAITKRKKTKPGEPGFESRP